MSEEGQFEIKVESPAPKSSSDVPKWEALARERIQVGVKRLSKPIEALKARDAVEADTRHLVTDILCDVLGFDKYEDLTAEYQVKGEFADYGVRIEKQLTAFVEVKRISQKLSITHLRQVENYALKNGVHWAILTNAQSWQVYYVQPITGEQSELTLVLEIDLLDPNLKPKHKVDLLLAMSREGISKGLLEERWRARFVSSPKALRPILLSEKIVNEVRLELWRTHKARVENPELRAALEAMLK